MKDTMISVRMPSTLVNELKFLAKENHYLDLSEQLRDVIRRKCVQILDTDSKQPHQTPTPTASSTSRHTQSKLNIEEKQMLIDNLSNIIEELKKGL